MDAPRAARAACLLATLAVALSGCDAAGGIDPAVLTSDATIRARHIAFEPVEVRVRAGQPVTLVLDNADDGVPHGLAVVTNNAVLASTEIVIGPASDSLELPSLAPGEYTFACPVHPNMTGTITAVP